MTERSQHSKSNIKFYRLLCLSVLVHEWKKKETPSERPGLEPGSPHTYSVLRALNRLSYLSCAVVVGSTRPYNVSTLPNPSRTWSPDARPSTVGACNRGLHSKAQRAAESNMKPPVLPCAVGLDRTDLTKDWVSGSLSSRGLALRCGPIEPLSPNLPAIPDVETDLHVPSYTLPHP